MKVIKQGPPPQEPYQFTCRKCKSVIEAEAKEGRRYTSPMNEDLIDFDCPVCWFTNTLPKHSYRTT